LKEEAREWAATDEEKAMDAVAKLVQRVGPYLLLEVVMPGGTLMALALYLYRRHRGIPL
jgi:hypothetical protein